MLPTLEIGTWQFNTYVMVYLLAVLVGVLYSFARLARLDYPPAVLYRGVVLATVAAFASAYLVRLLLTFQRYFQSGAWDPVGGSSFAGGLLGGIGVLFLYCRHQGIPIGRVLDQMMPPLALAQAIGRLGCFASGCCYGRPTTAWPGLFLPDSHGDWAVRYPTQFMSAGIYLLILFILLAVEKRQRKKLGHLVFDGFLALLYLGLYCLGRFTLEFLRADAIPLWGPFSWAQFYTVAGMILVTALLVWKGKVQYSAK